MKDPAFAAEYQDARAEIERTDKLMRALELARERAGITKAELARRIDAKPEMIRRLLTAANGNPTMSTVLKVVSALGCHFELVAARPPALRVEAVEQAQQSVTVFPRLVTPSHIEPQPREIGSRWRPPARQPEFARNQRPRAP